VIIVSEPSAEEGDEPVQPDPQRRVAAPQRQQRHSQTRGHGQSAFTQKCYHALHRSWRHAELHRVLVRSPETGHHHRFDGVHAILCLIEDDQFLRFEYLIGHLSCI